MVFDLINAGPRRRFVVADENGQPLIVHNCENITQAAARDIMAHNMLEVEARGYHVIATIHDEIVTETLDSGQWNAKTLSSLLAANPPWADGLPLAAEGWEAQRYRK